MPDDDTDMTDMSGSAATIRAEQAPGSSNFSEQELNDARAYQNVLERIAAMSIANIKVRSGSVGQHETDEHENDPAYDDITDPQEFAESEILSVDRNAEITISGIDKHITNRLDCVENLAKIVDSISNTKNSFISGEQYLALRSDMIKQGVTLDGLAGSLAAFRLWQEDDEGGQSVKDGLGFRRWLSDAGITDDTKLKALRGHSAIFDGGDSKMKSLYDLSFISCICPDAATRPPSLASRAPSTASRQSGHS